MFFWPSFRRHGASLLPYSLVTSKSQDQSSSRKVYYISTWILASTVHRGLLTVTWSTELKALLASLIALDSSPRGLAILLILAWSWLQETQPCSKCPQSPSRPVSFHLLWVCYLLQCLSAHTTSCQPTAIWYLEGSGLSRTLSLGISWRTWPWLAWTLEEGSVLRA